MPVEFGEVLDSVAPCGDGWSATVPDDWTQGRTAYGGLQGALLARAMRQVVRGAAELPLRGSRWPSHARTARCRSRCPHPSIAS